MQTPCSNSEDYGDIAKFGFVLAVTSPFWIVYAAFWLMSPIFWCIGKFTIGTMTWTVDFFEKRFGSRL